MDKRWHEAAIDTNVLIQLQDLTTILSQVDIQLDLTYGSFVDLTSNRLTVSSLWDTLAPHIQTSGYKTDVYLRALGTLHYSDLPALHHMWDYIEGTYLKHFASQLFTLLEDLRLEDIIIRLRPGTATDFSIRTKYLKQFFATQLRTNITQAHALDELFCMIYLVLQADGPEQSFPQAHKQQVDVLDLIKPDLYESYGAPSTERVADIVVSIIEKLPYIYEDMRNTYVAFPLFKWAGTIRENTLFDELTRTDDVANQDEQEVEQDEDAYIDETFSTWHRENENTDRQQTFLQMDLDVGTKTNLAGGDARETESGDQAFAAVQGMSKKSKQADYSEREALAKHDGGMASQQHEAPYGADNIYATAIMKDARPPTDEEQLTYETYVMNIKPYERKLGQTIEKILEHKKSFERNHLKFGRLSKNLLPVVTEDHPRLFYKKDNESSEFDAIFTLMVDCSASMYDKMEETKAGIVLFHEVLKQLKIPHQIVGFWEEATIGFNQEQPNYFHIIHSFTDSLYEQNGAKIMQLEPKEDNRDGFSIRKITEQMVLRHEKHKLLLVFSDGEPSAENYEQNGVIDTQRAVANARRQGIDVIGMFLSDGTINKRDDEMMKTIYGHERLMIPHVADLPELFIPVLKKLILQTI